MQKTSLCGYWTFDTWLCRLERLGHLKINNNRNLNVSANLLLLAKETSTEPTAIEKRREKTISPEINLTKHAPHVRLQDGKPGTWANYLVSWIQNQSSPGFLIFSCHSAPSLSSACWWYISSLTCCAYLWVATTCPTWRCRNWSRRSPRIMPGC